jgi:mannosyltransferase OCH1-like enzyme
MIPKKIWQTHKYQTQNDLPAYMQGPSLSWSVENPDFLYEYVPNSAFADFIFDNFGKEWLNIFKLSDSEITKADIWRLLCLYKYGGIYADIDTVCIKPVSSFINMDADFVIESSNIFCNEETSNTHDFKKHNSETLEKSNSVIDGKNFIREITNSVFATKPGGYFITLLLENVKNKCLKEIKSGRNLIGFALTGPQSFADIYRKNPEAVNFVEFFDQEQIIELNGSQVWNDFRRDNMSFSFSDLGLGYGSLCQDTKNEIKFFGKNGHGGFVYKN